VNRRGPDVVGTQRTVRPRSLAAVRLHVQVAWLEPDREDALRVKADDRAAARLVVRVARLGDRLGVAPDLEEADAPRVGRVDVVDDETGPTVGGDVPELAATGHVVATDVDRPQLLVDPEADRIVLQGAVGLAGGQTPDLLALQVCELLVGEHAWDRRT
jgi:hypothetical protein